MAGAHRRHRYASLPAGHGPRHPGPARGVGAAPRRATAATVVNGAYYDDCEPIDRMHGNATNEEDAIRLFDLCLALTKDFQQ